MSCWPAPAAGCWGSATVCWLALRQQSRRLHSELKAEPMSAETACLLHEIWDLVGDG